MTTYIALLRAVNVGGTGKLKMADLVKAMKALGYERIATYVQSGNVVFDARKSDAATIEKRIKKETFLLTARELEKIAGANPYANEAKADPTKVFAAFLSGKPSKDGLAKLAAMPLGNDRFTPGRGVLYLHLPMGAGTAKLSGATIERVLGVRATARNWRTVSKLIEIVADERGGD